MGETLNGFGGLLLGIAALITAGWGLHIGRQAKRDSRVALMRSPDAEIEGLRETVARVSDAYKGALSRHATEREGMEASLMRERERAEQAEQDAFILRAELATIRIDFAETRREVADLRSRFEASLNH